MSGVQVPSAPLGFLNLTATRCSKSLPHKPATRLKGETAMARKRRGPWQRKQHGCWYTTVGRTLHKLGEADDPWKRIEDAYHKLHAKSEKPARVSVARLCDQFLDYAEKHRAAGTYGWYKYYLAELCATMGPRLRV